MRTEQRLARWRGRRGRGSAGNWHFGWVSAKPRARSKRRPQRKEPSPWPPIFGGKARPGLAQRPRRAPSAGRNEGRGWTGPRQWPEIRCGRRNGGRSTLRIQDWTSKGISASPGRQVPPFPARRGLTRMFHGGGWNGTSVSPSGLWPDGRLRATFVEGHGFGNSLSCSVPVGESPTGTGGSPVLPRSGGSGYKISGPRACSAVTIAAVSGSSTVRGKQRIRQPDETYDLRPASYELK